MAKRKMLKFSPELDGRLTELVKIKGLAAEKKKMFGHETWFLNGYMFTGANEAGIFVHVGAAMKEKALAEEEGLSVFEPISPFPPPKEKEIPINPHHRTKVKQRSTAVYGRIAVKVCAFGRDGFVVPMGRCFAAERGLANSLRSSWTA